MDLTPLIVVVGTIAVLAMTGNLFAASPLVIAAQAAAIGLSVWARRSFPKGSFGVGAAPRASSIIRRGPYRILRHPMYSAALLFIWAGILSHLSVLPVTLGFAVTAVVLLRILTEERLLRTRYADYGAYVDSTKALIPFVL